MGTQVYETKKAAEESAKHMMGWDNIRIERYDSGDTPDDIKGWCISAQHPGTNGDRVYEQEDGFMR